MLEAGDVFDRPGVRSRGLGRVTCGSIPHGSSVIYVKTTIQHSKHGEHSPLRRARGARKAQSVKTARQPKTTRSGPAVFRSYEVHL